MSIWPGHRYPGYVEQQGKDPVEEPREGGQLYAREWLRVLKAHPRFVTIADWNNFEEETAIEDSYSWEDPRGYAVPDLYVRITRAYSRLRDGTLVKGEYYRDEANPDVYLFDGERLLFYESAMPRRAAVIVTPPGLLARFPRQDKEKGRPQKMIGMYAHQHWPYNHPYAARTWTLEDWRGYKAGDLLAYTPDELVGLAPKSSENPTQHRIFAPGPAPGAPTA